MARKITITRATAEGPVQSEAYRIPRVPGLAVFSYRRGSAWVIHTPSGYRVTDARSVSEAIKRAQHAQHVCSVDWTLDRETLMSTIGDHGNTWCAAFERGPVEAYDTDTDTDGPNRSAALILAAIQGSADFTCERSGCYRILDCTRTILLETSTRHVALCDRCAGRTRKIWSKQRAAGKCRVHVGAAISEATWRSHGAA